MTKQKTPRRHAHVRPAEPAAVGTTYLSDAQLARRYGVHRVTIWRWATTGTIPQPVRLSPGVTRWRADEVEARDAARPAGLAACPD